MAEPSWETIHFKEWAQGDLRLDCNEFGGLGAEGTDEDGDDMGPVVLTLLCDPYSGGSSRESHWMSPVQARALAAQLIAAADACDKAGPFKGKPK